MVSIIEYKEQYFDDVAYLLACFRVTLKSFKNEIAEIDVIDAKDELSFYLNRKYPLYLALIDNKVVGYLLLRVDGVAWVEHIYVLDGYRRKGVASMLYQKAEDYSISVLHEENIFNYVHPNNDVMIRFLKSKGYDVLNLIEIRKPFKDEKNTTKIKVGNNEFDY